MSASDRDGDTSKPSTAYGEYDAETVERVHQENIRKSKLAAELNNQAGSEPVMLPPQKYTWKSQPRHVGDNEISSYQGIGDKKQMLRAQARKRRQVRRQEASIWDNIAPKEMHGILNVILFVILAGGLAIVFMINGLL